MTGWLVVMVVLGQSDGGLSPPPPPPQAIPEDISFPRVIRTTGKVCVESLDEFGAVKSECRSDAVVVPKPSAPKRPPSRVVVELSVMGGGLLSFRRLIPEFAFLADAGVRFRNGVGVVGLVHGNVALGASRYGAGAALRLGDRSHVLLGASGGVLVFPIVLTPAIVSFAVLAQLALVFAEYFTVSLMPTLSVTAIGALASVTAGLGLTF